MKKHIFIGVGIFSTIIIHTTILLQTVFWPASEFRVFPYLTAKGLIPYKEIIDQHFPGIFFLPINLYTLGLATPYGLRFLQLIIVFVTHILLFFVIKKKTVSYRKAFFGAFLYISFQIMYEGYSLWIDSLITPIIFLSFAFLVVPEHKKPSYYFLSGLFLGIAIVFKQLLFTSLVFLLLYFLIVRKTKKEILHFLFGCFLPLLYLLFNGIQKGIIIDFFYWTVIFNGTIYKQLAFRQPIIKEIILYALIFIPSFFALYKGMRSKQQYQLTGLLVCYMIPLSLFVIGRYDFMHLQPFIPFAVVSMIVMLTNKSSLYASLIYGIYAIFIYSTMFFHISSLGKSTTLIDDSYKDTITTIKEFKKQNKTILILNGNYELYQLTNTLPANRLFSYRNQWYLDVIEYHLYKSLQETKPDIIVKQKGIESNSKKIDDFVAKNYSTYSETNRMEFLTIK